MNVTLVIKQRLGIFLLLLLFLLSISLIRVQSTSPCPECPHDSQCPALPTGCQEGYQLCDCCPSCRGKEGNPCSSKSVPCEDWLLCANTHAQSPEFLPWWLPFEGTCQHNRSVEILPLSDLWGVK